jgi:hypothetical protein
MYPAVCAQNNFFTGRVIKTGPRPTYSATWYTSEYVDNLTIASNGKVRAHKLHSVDEAHEDVTVIAVCRALI